MTDAELNVPDTTRRPLQTAFLSIEAALPLALLNTLFAAMLVLILWSDAGSGRLLLWASAVVVVSAA
ncbi:MAG: hypothetical protein AAFU65_02605, partial [Pseudomonadota bacterium]